MLMGTDTRNLKISSSSSTKSFQNWMHSSLENKSEKLCFSNITSNLAFFALPGFRKDVSKSDPQSGLAQILTNFFRVHPNNMCLRVSKKDFNVSVQPASLSCNAFGALVLEIGNAHLENNREIGKSSEWIAKKYCFVQHNERQGKSLWQNNSVDFKDVSCEFWASDTCYEAWKSSMNFNFFLNLPRRLWCQRVKAGVLFTNR